MDKLVTFCTPTYNRAHILHRCYESLCAQSDYDFEWIVIDDGSTDNTREIVYNWIQNENRFNIQYTYKENGGFHTAFNLAVEMVQTPLFVCFESDDCFTSDAMSIIKKNWVRIKDNSCVGFITLCMDSEGNLIGEKYPEEMKTILFRDHRKNTPGDKQFVFKTEALKRVFPMPSFKGEKYFDPSFKFFSLDNYGELAVTNDIFDVVEYQPEGLTHTIIHQYYNSPNSFAELRKLYMQLPNQSFLYIMKQNIHYVASYRLAGKIKSVIDDSPRKAYTVLAYLPGLLWAEIIKLLNKESKRNNK